MSQFAAKLTSRGIVNVSGPDSLRFLQGLVTCDVHQIRDPGPKATTAAFLNGRGRLLFGALLLHRNPNDYLIDIDRVRIPDLLHHLKKHKLRAKVDLKELTDSYNVWSLVAQPAEQFDAHAFIFDDPRVPALGKRAIVPRDFTPDAVPPFDEAAFTRLRILNGVPDGADFCNTPLPLDLALQDLNGVSFTKGCYLGQELTARSHFTGVLRKRITPVGIWDRARLGEVCEDAGLKLETGMELFVEGKKKAVGVVGSCVGNIGLAVLRVGDVFGGGDATVFTGDGRVANAWRPEWWSDISCGVPS